MKILPLSALSLVLGAGSVLACPWAGGSYAGDDKSRGLQVAFAVNAECSQISFQSSGNAGFQPVDTPQSFPMTVRNKHWETDINGARATFSADGKWVEFFANGNNVRVFVFK